jgi:hypothetical protein
MAKAQTPKTRKPREPRARQGHLEGEGFPKHVAELEIAAEEYVQARDARMAELETEVEKQLVLLGLMLKHGFKNYEYDGKIITLNDVQKVSVRKKKAEKESAE